MNLHGGTMLRAAIRCWAHQGKLFASIGDPLAAGPFATMTPEEARALAADLIRAADEGQATVPMAGLQSANEDLMPTQHASLGVPA